MDRGQATLVSGSRKLLALCRSRLSPSLKARPHEEGYGAFPRVLLVLGRCEEQTPWNFLGDSISQIGLDVYFLAEMHRCSQGMSAAAQTSNSKC